MNQPRLIARNTLTLGLSQVVERFGTIYLSIFVARKLGPEGLGMYSAAMVYYGLLFLAAELGTTTYLIREIAKDRDQTSKLVAHTSIVTGVLGCFLAAVARLVLPRLGYSQELQQGLCIIVWAAIPATLRAIQESVFVAYQRTEFLTYSAIIASVANLGVALSLLWQGFGVVSLLAAFALVQFVVAVFYFVTIHRYITIIRWQFSMRFLRKMLREIRPFTGSSLVQGFLSRPEIILLSFFHNEAQIGYYSAAIRVVDLWQLIPRSFMTNVFPVMSHYYNVGDSRTICMMEKSIKYLLAVSLPISASLIILARPILRLLYGGAFGNSVTVMQVLAWTVPLVFLWEVLWRVLSARGEHGSIFTSQLATLLVRLSAGYVIIRSFGSVGAAICTTASMLAIDLLLAYYVRRNGTRIALVRLSGRSMLATTGMAAIMYILDDRMPMWVVLVASAIAYTALVLAARVFSAEDLGLVQKLWQVGGT